MRCVCGEGMALSHVYMDERGVTVEVWVCPKCSQVRRT